MYLIRNKLKTLNVQRKQIYVYCQTYVKQMFLHANAQLIYGTFLQNNTYKSALVLEVLFLASLYIFCGILLTFQFLTLLLIYKDLQNYSFVQ